MQFNNWHNLHSPNASSLVDGSDATLKRFYRDKGKIRLQPANATFKPIVVDNVNIQGVVVGVIRKM